MSGGVKDFVDNAILGNLSSPHVNLMVLPTYAADIESVACLAWMSGGEERDGGGKDDEDENEDEDEDEEDEEDAAPLG